jgi:hypothetical protein
MWDRPVLIGFIGFLTLLAAPSLVLLEREAREREPLARPTQEAAAPNRSPPAPGPIVASTTSYPPIFIPSEGGSAPAATRSPQVHPLPAAKPAEPSPSLAPLQTIRNLEATGPAPNFVPWPPPMPTASYAYTPEWVHKHRTIGDLSADIEDVLRNSGYTQFSYTSVPDGFALATRFERIDQIEAPMTDTTRWAPLAKDVPKTWLDAMKSLFVGRQGRCRLFVFFLTTDNRAPSREEPTVDEATKWSLGGNPTLQSDLVDVLLTPKHLFYVYEYEFVEEASADIVEAPASAVPLDQELRIVKLLR